MTALWGLALWGLATAPADVPLRRADVHQHLTTRDAVWWFDGRPDGPVVTTAPDQLWRNQISSASLRAAGLGLLIGTVWPEPRLRPGATSLTIAEQHLGRVAQLCHSAPAFACVRSSEAAVKAMSLGRVAVFPALEGAESVREVDDVDRLYAAGARSIGLVHFVDNELAGAEVGQFGTLSAVLADEGGGLTPLGHQAVERMIDLGILVDLSHASDRTIADVLGHAERRGVPVLFSHAGSSFSRPRTLTDEFAGRIARGGGVIGVGVYRSDFLVPVPEVDRWPGFVAGSCDELIAHWLHLGRLVGFEHVVLGSDFNSPIMRGAPGGSCADGVRSTADLPAVFEALVRRGVPVSTLDDSAARVLALIRAVESKADPARQRSALARPPPASGGFNVPSWP